MKGARRREGLACWHIHALINHLVHCNAINRQFESAADACIAAKGRIGAFAIAGIDADALIAKLIHRNGAQVAIALDGLDVIGFHAFGEFHRAGLQIG